MNKEQEEGLFEALTRQRIDELRIKNGLSERKLSLDLGHSSTYIHNILNKKSLPSFGEFLYICEYFQIEPKEFFDIDHEASVPFLQARAVLEQLSDADIETLLPILKKFLQN